MIMYGLLKIILVLQAVRVGAGEYCQYGYDYYFSSSYKSRYCDDGCCGTKSSTYSDVCCSVSSYSSSTVNVGAIVGSVVGSLVGLALLIAVIKCCTAAYNSRRQTGTVIQPANTNMQAFVVSTSALSPGQQAMPIPQGPVGYGYPTCTPPPPYGLQCNVPQESAEASKPPLPPT
ncbi:hypothetical protein CHS0354_016482 [Potamilus streckersoni]|uniref:Cysteine and tyrosine-rich protein 1 n=1 Tax=Potamilus streckersoni TaxID=2493646 RepID=A0AAE0WG68_9BIVA|nr:hypothetical protein CHS0354_016482 [Potamilus streckersoni]